MGRKEESVDYPAIAAHALLAGLDALGLSRAKLESAIELAGDLTELERRLPMSSWEQLFQLGRAQLARAGASEAEQELLALRGGLSIPFGAFGTVDYLVASAASVGAGVQTLVDHFAALSTGFRITKASRGDGGCTVQVVDERPTTFDNDDFTLGALVGRFRWLAGPDFEIEQAVFRRIPLDPSAFELALGIVPVFGTPPARLELSSQAVAAPMRQQDRVLHHTLRQLAAQLRLGSATNDLELAIRCRLRDRLMAEHQDATSVGPIARSLGMSERTLHRRLADRGLSFRAIVDTFRAQESERYLLSGSKTQAEIAHALGYSEQSTWARAFRRWRGCSPGEWMKGAFDGG